MESFEPWLQHRVAQAVESGDVPAELLTELQAEFEVARASSQDEGHAAAIQHIADLAGVPETEARTTLEAIEAQPAVTQQLLMRRFVEPWLEGQQKAYRKGGPQNANTQGKRETASRILLESRLRYHHRCLWEDATDPELTSLERLALIRDRARRMGEIRGTLRAWLAAGRKLP